MTTSTGQHFKNMLWNWCYCLYFLLLIYLVSLSQIKLSAWLCLINLLHCDGRSFDRNAQSNQQWVNGEMLQVWVIGRFKMFTLIGQQAVVVKPQASCCLCGHDSSQHVGWYRSEETIYLSKGLTQQQGIIHLTTRQTRWQIIFCCSIKLEV